MAIFYKTIVSKLIGLTPLLVLFYLCLSEIDTQFENFYYLSFNLQYIIIFYWVLKNPNILGSGFIFTAGIVNDVALGLPLGLTSLTYLFMASIAAYVRNLTVTMSLFTDWVTFVPAILTVNLFYYFILMIFFEIPVDYLALLLNSMVTIIIYPVGWIVFEVIRNLMKGSQTA